MITSLFFTVYIDIVTIVIFLLISVAYYTLLERKVLAMIQRRQGPNVVGVFGLLQPLSDGLKLFMKETTIPGNANKFLLILAPVLSFFLSLLSWGVIPFDDKSTLSNINLSLLFILATSSVGVYGIVIAGWASNSKYAFLGGLRSSAQMVSYELPLVFTVLTVVLCAGSANLNEIIWAQRYVWYCFPLLIPFLIFFISSLAETSRHPFDLPEAESELVAGYNVEYSAMGFAMFSLAEYSNILMMCTLNSILFFGGWLSPFSGLIEYLSEYSPFMSCIAFIYFLIPGSFWLAIKIVFFAIIFVYIRATQPRYRYNDLMNLGWKKLLPVSFGFLILVIAIIYNFSIYPK